MLTIAALLLAGADPASPKARWINDLDYPPDALRNGMSGTVEFTLSFDDTGRVTGCTVTRSAGDPLLDAAACQLSQRRGRALPGTPRQQSFFYDWKPTR